MRIDMTRIRNRRVHTALHPTEDKLLGDTQVKNHTLVRSGGNDRRPPESSHSQELRSMAAHDPLLFFALLVSGHSRSHRADAVSGTS
jgi:hypothetical protein